MRPSIGTSHLLLLVAVTLLLSSFVSAIQLQNASYSVKTASLFGNTYTYAMFEAQFDEELYLLRQWPCQCTNNSLPCAAGSSQTNPPGINETIVNPSTGKVYSMPLLQEGQWYNGSIMNPYDVQYMKFHVPYSSAMPCPIITIDFEMKTGTLSVFAASSYIPTLSTYQWARAFVNPSTIAICPSNPNFVFGSYYLLINNQAGRVSNIYSIRYTLQNSPQCTQIPVDYSTVPILPVPNTTAWSTPVWLEDGIMNSFTLAPLPAPRKAHQWYALYAPERCALFNVGLYKDTYADGQILLLGSATNSTPTVTNSSSVQWSSLFPADNKLDLHYCNPDLSANYSILYIGVYVGTAVGSYKIIGTTQRYTPSVPYSSLAFSQSRLDAEFGALPALSCDNGIYTCSYHAFQGCLATGVACCVTFWPVAPEEHPQTLWPWLMSDTSIGQFHTAINWTDMAPLVPGKLAAALWLEWDSPTGRTVEAISDPGTCVLTLGPNWVDSTDTPVPTTHVTFEPTKKQCDYDTYHNISGAMDALAQTYPLQKNVHDLALQQMRIVRHSWYDEYQACSNYVESEFTSVVPQYNSTTVYICPYRLGTPEYAADACCNSALLPKHSCGAIEVNYSLPITGNTLSDAIDAQCSNPQCSESLVQSWLQQDGYIANPNSGCLADFAPQASVSVFNSLLTFTYHCKNMIQGLYLTGVQCTSSAQCYKNAACLPDTKTCNHTYNDVLDCFANEMSTDTALSLFNMWGLTQNVTYDALIAELYQHWVTPICVGPSSQDYRQGFKFSLVDPNCNDTCKALGLEPYCPDISLWRSGPCAIPPICDYAQTSGTCFRFWRSLTDDRESCENAKVCNWRQPGYNPCPEYSQIDCNATCLNGSEYACLNLADSVLGSYLEITEITNSSRCDQGLCSAGIEITNATECANSGNCSISCPTCDTSFGCMAAGVCSDATQMGAVSGICVYPAPWTGSAYSCAYFPPSLPFTVLTSIGCVPPPSKVALFPPSVCSMIPGASWYNLSTDRTTCLAREACFDPAYNTFFLGRNATECAICPTCQWKSVFKYSYGTWTPGTVQPLAWLPRTYATATSYVPDINYFVVTQDAEQAISNDFSYAYYTEALCRYDNLDGLVDSILCDCTTTDGNCFNNQGTLPIGAFKVCPYQGRSFGTLDANVTVSNVAVPVSGGCQVIEIAATSVGKYQVPPNYSVVNPLFKKIQANPYLIVKNAQSAVVGQLISDAISVTIPFSLLEEATLCIQSETYITIDSSANLLSLAQLTSDGSIVVFENSFQYAINTSDDSSTNRISVCGTINGTGTFFAVALVPDYHTVNPTPSGQTYAALCIYIVLIAFSCLQAILLLLDRTKQKLLGFKLVALFIIVLNSTVRCVYVLPPKNAFPSGSDSVQFIVYELPTFLYFSVFTVVVYLWLLVVMSTRHFGRQTAVSRGSQALRNSFIGINLFMYFVFVVFIYLLAIIPSATQQSPCFLGNLDSAISSAERSIKITYWAIQMVISIVLCAGFIIAAVSLLSIVIKLRQGTLAKGPSGGQRAQDRARAADIQMIIITVVAFVCVVFLLVRCVLFLEVAVNNSTIEVIAFCMLEVIPQTMLAFYLHPLRCFTEAGRSSTSSKKSRSITGTSKTATKSATAGGQSLALETAHTAAGDSESSSEDEEDGEEESEA